MNWTMIDPILENAIREDLGSGDITTAGIGLKARISKGRFVAKEDGIVCGLEVARRVFLHVDRLCGEEEPVFMEILTAEGDPVRKGDVLATIQGPPHRFFGRTGRAQFSAAPVRYRNPDRGCGKADSGTQARIVDTRKTTPGLGYWKNTRYGPEEVQTIDSISRTASSSRQPHCRGGRHCRCRSGNPKGCPAYPAHRSRSRVARSGG
jgi:hypothetical protein